jgi:hypothetical protein
MVTTSVSHDPVTPAGKPDIVAPVAPVVEYVMFVIGVLIHTVCASVPAPEVSDTVLSAVTFMVPIVDTVPQPPVSVTV